MKQHELVVDDGVQIGSNSYKLIIYNRSAKQLNKRHEDPENPATRTHKPMIIEPWTSNLHKQICKQLNFTMTTDMLTTPNTASGSTSTSTNVDRNMGSSAVHESQSVKILMLSREELNSFKVEPCTYYQSGGNRNKDTATSARTDTSNQQLIDDHHATQAPYFYSCPHYHTNKDKRRRPYLANSNPNNNITNDKNNSNTQTSATGTKNTMNKNGKKKQKLAYSAQYLGDNYDEQICLNWIQYLYHPLVYKTKICENVHCARKYCSKIHTHMHIHGGHDGGKPNGYLNGDIILSNITNGNANGNSNGNNRNGDGRENNGDANLSDGNNKDNQISKNLGTYQSQNKQQKQINEQKEQCFQQNEQNNRDDEINNNITFLKNIKKLQSLTQYEQFVKDIYNPKNADGQPAYSSQPELPISNSSNNDNAIVSKIDGKQWQKKVKAHEQLIKMSLNINNYIKKMDMYEQEEASKLGYIRNEIINLAGVSTTNANASIIYNSYSHTSQEIVPSSPLKYRQKTQQQTSLLYTQTVYKQSTYKSLKNIPIGGSSSTNNPNRNIRNGKQEDYDIFFYMQQLKIVEDRHHEFKMFRDKDPRRIADLVLEYISAFLNSDGGSIYLGINDQSIVHGIQANQKWLDQFKLALDSNGRNYLSPPLIPQKYDLRIIPVNHTRKTDLKVIQIKVYPQKESDKKILTLFKKQCYLRMNASNHRLAAADIMEYMRLVNSNSASNSDNSNKAVANTNQYPSNPSQNPVPKQSQYPPPPLQINNPTSPLPPQPVNISFLTMLTKLENKLDDLSAKDLREIQESLSRVEAKVGEALTTKEKEEKERKERERKEKEKEEKQRQERMEKQEKQQKQEREEREKREKEKQKEAEIQKAQIQKQRERQNPKNNQKQKQKNGWTSISKQKYKHKEKHESKQKSRYGPKYGSKL